MMAFLSIGQKPHYCVILFDVQFIQYHVSSESLRDRFMSTCL